MPLVHEDQRSAAWHAARSGKITASLAAACLGLDPHKSRAAAWRAIKGEKQGENRHMRWGTEFEPVARREYETLSGNLVDETGFWVHPEYDWLGASPDGLIDADGLLEIKCPGKLPTAIPLHHRIQMLIQLACTGRKWCDYFVFTHDGYFTRRVFPVGIPGLIRRLDAFRREFVLADVEPPRKRRKAS